MNWQPTPISDNERRILLTRMERELEARAQRDGEEGGLSSCVIQSLRTILTSATIITDESARVWDEMTRQQRSAIPTATPSDASAALKQAMQAAKAQGKGQAAAIDLITEAIREMYDAPPGDYQRDHVARIVSKYGLAATAEAAQSLLRTGTRKKTDVANPWNALDWRAKDLVAGHVAQR